MSSSVERKVNTGEWGESKPFSVEKYKNQNYIIFGSSLGEGNFSIRGLLKEKVNRGK